MLVHSQVWGTLLTSHWSGPPDEAEGFLLLEYPSEGLLVPQEQLCTVSGGLGGEEQPGAF